MEIIFFFFTIFLNFLSKQTELCSIRQPPTTNSTSNQSQNYKQRIMLSQLSQTSEKNTAKTLRFVVSAYQNYVTITHAYDMRHLAQVNEATKLSATEREIK